MVSRALGHKAQETDFKLDISSVQNDVSNGFYTLMVGKLPMVKNNINLTTVNNFNPTNCVHHVNQTAFGVLRK